MQTFLPYMNFNSCAAALDTRRLGKQIVEVKQILTALASGPGAPWYEHPVTQMWQGCTASLACYGWACCLEWYKRQNAVRPEAGVFFGVVSATSCIEPPGWICHEMLYAGHRGHLYRKDSSYYAAFGIDATTPLLYPVALDGDSGNGWVYVERVREGQFRLRSGPICPSVKAAVAAAEKLVGKNLAAGPFHG